MAGSGVPQPGPLLVFFFASTRNRTRGASRPRGTPSLTPPSTPPHTHCPFLSSHAVPQRPPAHHLHRAPGRRSHTPARVRPPGQHASSGGEGCGQGGARVAGAGAVASGGSRQAGGCGALKLGGERERKRVGEEERGRERLHTPLSPSTRPSPLHNHTMPPPPADSPIFAATLPLTCVAAPADVAAAVSGASAKRTPTSPWAVRVEAAAPPAGASLWVTANPPGRPLTVLGARVDAAGYEELRVGQVRT